MGQYYRIVNLDKQEFIHPHRFGDGLKLLEFSNSSGGTMTALALLCSSGNGRGGGDLHEADKIVGTWAGDRIVVAGDYDDEGKFLTPEQIEAWQKLHEVDEVPNLYHVSADLFKDISVDIIVAMCADSYVREGIIESLAGGFCAQSEESNSLLRRISDKYDCSKEVEDAMEEYQRVMNERFSRQ